MILITFIFCRNALIYPGLNVLHMSTNIIRLLNSAVKDELTAIYQYLYFHFHGEDQGLKLTAGLFKRTAIEEMKHVEKLAERILFLDGDVDLSLSKPVEPISDIGAMLKLSCKLELEQNGVGKRQGLQFVG
jgi:bacterioferritin